MNQLVITLMGPDRPGIVADLAGWVTEQGGNWLESRMLRLGGQFAGTLRIEIDPAALPMLEEKLASLRERGLRLDWTHEPKTSPKTKRRSCLLKLCAQDQPGIVKQVFEVFSAHKVNVEELKTGTRGAPWSGHTLFEAEAQLSIPESVDLSSVRQSLEALSNDLMVEIELMG
ncbi:MAG: glycine cleavage system protein R [Opitutales bacterium]|nr:glycine cleavage system protein R [Opitutales bacterium]